MTFGHMEIRETSKERAKKMIMEYHYMKYLPQLNDIFIGGYLDGDLAAVMTLGWGVRPRHTIEKLFPSMGVDDYRSLGRLCAVEDLPQNTESHFISKAFSYVKNNYPNIELIFSWSDGVLGKPGIVYQASNFYYGGYIWTDLYMSDEGERVHPRQTNRIGGRPSYDELDELGWEHYRGKQFRYIYPLVDASRWEELKEESEFEWTKGNYPKGDDCEWKVKTDDGWVYTEQPEFDPETLTFNSKKGDEFRKHKEQHELGAFGHGNNQRWDRYAMDSDEELFSLNTRNG